MKESIKFYLDKETPIVIINLLKNMIISVETVLLNPMKLAKMYFRSI